MRCPNCNKHLSDGSKACPKCGTSFVNNASPTKPLSVSQVAAQNELKKKQYEGKLLPILCIELGIIFCALGFIDISAIILGGFLVVVGVLGLYEGRKRIAFLEKISSGKSVVAVCPYCKSTNISMSIVHSGTYSSQDTTFVSRNVNPFRPFTHTNIDVGDRYTSNNYKGKCQCKSCGYVFDKPEKYIR